MRFRRVVIMLCNRVVTVVGSRDVITFTREHTLPRGLREKYFMFFLSFLKQLLKCFRMKFKKLFLRKFQETTLKPLSFTRPQLGHRAPSW